ncbi:hypothetical protein SteCoe_13828 [Stentor coeruleus]|uniref:Uncharacterized protein n=1 Tax=Stentor coeruleus TaxID=5963 RepID=A0A1R2C7M9_9CILI|nr:hypothetical protein SteCoe_13828 [Stentor coeruleus]
MNICACGSPATHQCVECKPKVSLCVSCIINHIVVFPQDSIVPIRTSNIVSSDMCGICRQNKSVTLLIRSSQSVKACKVCKNTSENSVKLHLKWSNLVTQASDLSEFYERKLALKNSTQEINSHKKIPLMIKYLTEVENNLINCIKEEVKAKIDELKPQSMDEDKELEKLKKEVEEQALVKNPDPTVPGAQLLLSFLHRGKPFQFSSGKAILIDTKSLEDQIRTTIKSIKIDKGQQKKKSVYLFNPGKSTLTRVCLESLRKEEFIFDRNWTFEASWYELESGDLFFCGGNGIDNSEVLLVKSNPTSITNLEHFTGRSGHSIVEVPRNIYVFGGNKGGISEKYSFETGKWTVLPSIPQKISRVSAALINDYVIMTGADTDKLFRYNLPTDTYTVLGVTFDGYINKNKIVFTNNGVTYCMTGDKLFISNNLREWEFQSIADRDWWTYSRPIFHGGCIYFIKYFVRNLWQLNLETYKLTEIQLSNLPDLNS